MTLLSFVQPMVIDPEKQSEKLTTSIPLVKKKSISDFSKAKAVAFRLLKVRSRSEQEIRERLKQRNFTEAAMTETIQYLKAHRLIDDRQLAKDWISYHLERSYGLNRIRYELEAKGIADKIIRDELDPEKLNFNEEAIVLRIAKEQHEKHKADEQKKIKRRTRSLLAQRGFSPEVIEPVLEKVFPETMGLDN